jgi:hypothetical protein
MDDTKGRDATHDVGQLGGQEHKVVLTDGHNVHHHGVLVHVGAAVLVMRHQLLGGLGAVGAGKVTGLCVCACGCNSRFQLTSSKKKRKKKKKRKE